MASWNELKAHIHASYKVKGDNGELVSMVFAESDGRTQLTLVGRGHNTNTGEEWVQISSPIGEVARINLEAAARAAFDWLCGGIVVIDDRVYLHHAAPLANLDVNEFARPLAVITSGADSIERALLGTDEF